ncbi:helix-turn-helix domain-containing protein [Streptomyces sp. HSW2009]|uniref:helix-turn-helix domain-containing protein n=1 Tax=Streptomyces sp. HSW2009 TaxID=3142890 RepID=UPI0032EAE5C4
MPRWKALPDSLDQRVQQLVVQLRRLKDRSGLSMIALAAKTGYSRSSWDRYLNGQALPPQRAVEELARAAGADPVRLLVLHEVAKEAWQQSASAAPPDRTQDADQQDAAEQEETTPEAGAVSTEAPGPAADSPAAQGAPRLLSVRRSLAVAAVLAAVLLGVGAGMVIATPWDEEDGTTSRVKAAATASPTSTPGGPGKYLFRPGKTYSCPVRRDGGAGGGLFAGYSTTRTAVLAGPGWDVVEAQCLLRHHRLNPGTVDGIYGQQTIAAVVRLQKKAGLPADGVVGPHTWQELRG